MRKLVIGAMGVAAVLGACGGGSPSPLAVVSRAPAQTTAAKTSKVSVTVHMAGVTGLPAGGVSIGGEGAFDYGAGQGTLTLDLPAVGGVNIGRVDAVFAAGVVYEKLPSQFAAELGGKPWVKLDLRSVGADVSQLGQAQSDPTAGLNYLRGVTGAVTKVGDEKVRGTDTTHYRATVDLARAAAATPEPGRTALQKLVGLFTVKTFPVEVWIDGDNRVRRLTFTFDLSSVHVPNARTQPTGTMTMTMELFDFGTPVSVTLPPADQVTDLSALIGNQLQPGG